MASRGSHPATHVRAVLFQHTDPVCLRQGPGGREQPKRASRVGIGVAIGTRAVQYQPATGRLLQCSSHPLRIERHPSAATPTIQPEAQKDGSHHDQEQAEQQSAQIEKEHPLRYPPSTMV